MNARLANRTQVLDQEILRLGILSSDQLRVLNEAQLKDKRPLATLMTEFGFISDKALQSILTQQSRFPKIDLSHTTFDPETIALLSATVARKLRCIPITFDHESRTLNLATPYPDDLPLQDTLQRELGKEITISCHYADLMDVEQAIDRCYGHELRIDGILDEITQGKIAPQEWLTAEGNYRHPIVRLIDAFLSDAVKQGASDLHFEPESAFLRIRYRIDGRLQTRKILPRSCWPAMVVRLKIIGGMNITEVRAPQDGHLALSISGRTIDFRIACHPTLHGENIVLRILDRQQGIVPLAQLGFSESSRQVLERMLARPAGLILVTGPTGSGKTTTLYSILNQLNHESVHIMTLEDPVEYPLTQIRQTSVSESCKLDFANGIRSMMRQDPDIILVGEIRDAESARMAIQAAMTGHRVFSTLHTNSATGAIPRLIEMGIAPDLLAGNLSGVIAQRLVRRLCPHCHARRPASEYEQRLLHSVEIPPPELYHAIGCDACHGIGYRGRTAVSEVLRIDLELDALIARRAPLPELLAHLRIHGFSSLLDDGLRLVRQGMTSLDEVTQVIDFSERM